MDEKTHHDLERRGALLELETGEEGVRVSLHTSERPPSVQNRADLERVLLDLFKKTEQDFEPVGLRLAFGTLSVMGQCIEGVLPTKRFESMRKQLRERGIELDPVVTQQVI